MNTYTSDELHALDDKYYLPTFRRYPLAFKKGKGSRLWDIEGNEYIDALAGIAVNNVGHAHPKVANAIASQAHKLIHISNFYLSEPQMILAKKLTSMSGLERVFFGNSGTEAVEGAIKVARKYANKIGRGGTIIAMKNAFHGRTLASIAASGKESMMKGFAPIPTGFYHIPINDIDLIKEKVNNDTAAILLEPIQGEGGIIPAEKKFLCELRSFCDQENIVLVFDEVQCGIGRTGKMFAFEHFDLKPDVMSLAKGLGGGVPIGAVLASERIGTAIDRGDHGTTFGGNPLACAAALATLEVIDEEKLLKKATEDGEWIKEKVHAVSSKYPEIREIRGKGLMIGIELNKPTKPIVVSMMRHNVLTNATAENVIRIVPPLNIPREDLEKVIEVLFVSIEEHRNN
ncbi:MAG: aspartate aminotransferase family protein [Bacteroidota bacterium]